MRKPDKTAADTVLKQNPGFPPFDPKGYFENHWPDLNCHSGEASNWPDQYMDYDLAISALYRETYGHY